jgi:hypothetical protein
VYSQSVKSIVQPVQLPGANPPQQKKHWAWAATDHNFSLQIHISSFFVVIFMGSKSGKASVNRA